MPELAIAALWMPVLAEELLSSGFDVGTSVEETSTFLHPTRLAHRKTEDIIFKTLYVCFILYFLYYLIKGTIGFLFLIII